jgi:hypothetical protein
MRGEDKKFFRPKQIKERGCVEDQPQQPLRTNAREYIPSHAESFPCCD